MDEGPQTGQQENTPNADGTPDKRIVLTEKQISLKLDFFQFIGKATIQHQYELGDNGGLVRFYNFYPPGHNLAVGVLKGCLRLK